MSIELKVYTTFILLCLYPITVNIIGRAKKWPVRKQFNYALPWILFFPLTFFIVLLGRDTPPLLIIIFLGLMPIGYFAWHIVRNRYEKDEKEKAEKKS